MSLKVGKHFKNSSKTTRGKSQFFTSKGQDASDETVVSEGELEEIIKRLRENESVPITRLSGQLKTDFELLSHYISSIHQSNSYDLLKSKIDEQFFDINNIEPGTVGAYFTGTNMSVNIDPIECAAINAKTIPADNSDFKVCKNNIVIGERSHDGYKLELLNKGEDSSHTFLYLKDHNVYDDFEGFSNDEKKKLKKMGVEYVNLYGYGTDNTQYSDLVGNTVHVDELKSRKHQHREEGSSWGLWLIVFFIVFILIIILACSCVGSSSKAIYTTV